MCVGWPFSLPSGEVYTVQIVSLNWFKYQTRSNGHAKCGQPNTQMEVINYCFCLTLYFTPRTNNSSPGVCATCFNDGREETKNDNLDTFLSLIGGRIKTLPYASPLLYIWFTPHSDIVDLDSSDSPEKKTQNIYCNNSNRINPNFLPHLLTTIYRQFCYYFGRFFKHNICLIQAYILPPSVLENEGEENNTFNRIISTVYRISKLNRTHPACLPLQ